MLFLERREQILRSTSFNNLEMGLVCQSCMKQLRKSVLLQIVGKPQCTTTDNGFKRYKSFTSVMSEFAKQHLLLWPQIIYEQHWSAESSVQARWCVYAYHMCSVLFLPVQSLLTCFRSSQSQTSKFDRKTTIPRAQVTWSHITIIYVLQRGIWKHCTWRKWLT